MDDATAAGSIWLHSLQGRVRGPRAVPLSRGPQPGFRCSCVPDVTRDGLCLVREQERERGKPGRNGEDGSGAGTKMKRSGLNCDVVWCGMVKVMEQVATRTLQGRAMHCCARLG